ncbi:SGNH/GDSL hydrolase family protein [Nocardioides sp.]|uniref:SGNH/GDSL hydrolase family protein n=1 Tax=Nocardioides sp. TaxID=35761 RepID=UPI002B26EFB7|nr:SGNH/GDSL hydrolase family protein [Nocardioides sp.]
MRFRSTAALAVTLTLALSACSGSDASQDVSSVAEATPSPSVAPEPSADAVQYVALGDSYAAAPGVPPTDQAGGCFRSGSNYASVLAESADLFLTDVTCSGATSDDVVSEQVAALSPQTDLVTIGIGGNDSGLFSTILRSCLSFGDDGLSGAPCTEALTEQLDAMGSDIGASIGSALDAVTEAAPNAEVYVVGYPALLPESGTCPDLAPFAADDYPLLVNIIRGLSDALESAAAERELSFIDVYAASAGHDVCSDDPWVNGASMASDGTIPFHPFAQEQAAVADLLAAML